jgi:PAS domain S-box-containing protein
MIANTLEEISIFQETEPLRVLIVVHSRGDSELILIELKRAGVPVDSTVVQDRLQFRKALQASEFEAVLADFRLPSWTGIDAFQEMRASGKDIPFLLVTGTLGEEAAVECIKAGVSDYVLKNRISRLPVALKRAVKERALRQERAQAQAALAESERQARREFAELDLVYRTLPFALAVFDRELRFLQVNEQASRAHGISAAAHAGLRLRDVTPDIAEPMEKYLRQVFETGESIANIEIHGTVPSRPDEIRHWLCSYHPLRREEKTVSAATAIAIDITKRYQDGGPEKRCVELGQ